MVKCTTYDTGIEALRDLAFRNALGCAYEAGGFGAVEVAGLLLMAFVGISLWIRTESATMPFVVMMLTGSIVLPLVTAPAVALAMLVIAGVGAGAPLVLYRRMEVRG